MNRLRRPSPRRALLGFNAVVTAIGLISLGLAALGVQTVAVVAIFLFAFVVSEAALILVIWDYHKELETKLTPHKVAAQVNALLLERRELGKRLPKAKAEDGKALDAWVQDFQDWASRSMMLVHEQRPNRLMPVLEAQLDRPDAGDPIREALHEINGELKFDGMHPNRR